MTQQKFGPSMHVLYGVAIQDAMRRGDLTEMERVAAQARTHLDHYGDVASGLANLQKAIAGQKGPGAHPMPMYAQALQDAVASGDEERIKAARELAREQLAQSDQLRKALGALDDEIQKAEQ